MTTSSATTSKRSDQLVDATDAVDRIHPLRRGGFAVAVFSGHRRYIAELAGESTAHITHKFVLDDPTLDPSDDFARTCGVTLARWPTNEELQPADGACFVFSNAHHPAIRQLKSAGAIRGEHFVIIDENWQQADESRREVRLDRFLSEPALHVSEASPIVIVGFGHQGQLIARRLLEVHRFSHQQLAVWDSNAQSALVAAATGLRLITSEHELKQSSAIIASPLARYDQIESIMQMARAENIPVFNNAMHLSGLDSWQQVGSCWLDDSARRTLTVEADTTITCGNSTLAPLISAHIVRQDLRVLAGVPIPHLHSGQSHSCSGCSGIDLEMRWEGEGLAPETWSRFDRAYVSLRNRPEVGVFAARQFCIERWPDAVESMFPATHRVDLGSTTFERLIAAHVEGREVVASMQTPLQRVVLGVAAAQYSADRPIIEVGSALGGSGLHMAAATEARAPRLVSIDPDAPTRDIMRFVFERYGYGNRLCQIVKTSDAAIAELAAFRGSCGMVFIDGLHTADGVRNDFTHYAPLVAVGGALAVHDVCPELHSVMQAVTEFVLRDRRFRAICLVDGLLVLERVE